MLGDRYGTSCIGLVGDVVEQTLRGLGYTVSRNKPYAGGFITEHYGNPAAGLHAIQLEINRALYMDERRYQHTENFAQLAADMTALARRLGDIPVDELRPYTQGLWRAMSRTDRARFLRHLRPWWDVHRHRISPLVAGKLERMEAENRLAIEAGRLVSVEPCAEGLTIRYRPRGSAEVRELVAAKLVNATGPQGDLDRAREPLLRALRDRGRLRADPLGIGLDVDQDSRAIDRDGKASDELLVIGPMTRGAFWEIVAVPDIRRQAWSIARRLANSHWVEGEGL